MRRRWWDLLALAALVAVVLFFFARLAFTNLILGHGDAYLYFAPYWAYRDAALRTGEIPLWNPVLFMGVPFLANSQAGVLYPLNWLCALVPDLSAPDAIKWSLIGHLMLGGVLAYAYGRRTLHLARLAAWLGAALFALGGYLGMQLEHVNQVQALVWLPALFALAPDAGSGERVSGVRTVRGARRREAALRWALLAAVIALQLLAGHAQSAFVSLVALGVYVLWLSLHRLWTDAHVHAVTRPPLRLSLRSAWAVVRSETVTTTRAARPWHALPLATLVLAVALAVALAAGQLLPTFELSGESLRSEGLGEQEALAFSLAPPIAGRAFLPAYDVAIFNEYVAYLGAAALVLLALGFWAARCDPRVQALAATAFTGLFFALGMFNPVYRLLVRYAPGFDLFRAPARWLALWAFAGALLAAVGLDALLRARATRRAALVTGVAGFAVTAALVLLSALATTGVSGEVLLGWYPPARSAMAAWLGAAGLAAGLIILAAARPNTRGPVAGALALLVVAELYFGAAHLPYREPTTPQAWESVRPAMAHLLAAQAADPEPSLSVPRFLSLSRAEFDPGDVGELWSAYGPSWPSDCGSDPPDRPDLTRLVNPEPLLSPAQVCQLIIDTKQKEILSPNLPLAWALPAADGYDGGVLPLRHYATFARLLLPAGAETSDGRLRENVVDVPDGRVLSLMNVRWLITDKVGDVPYDGVFYDLRQSVTLGAGGAPSMTVALLPDFEATELRVVGRLLEAGALAPQTPVLRAMVTFDDGSVQWLEAVAGDLGTSGDGVARLSWSLPRRVRALALASRLPAGGTAQVVVRGATLVDARSGAFHMLVVSASGRYRLAHSADVKIYENLDVLPRAFVVPAAVAADDAAALEAMRAPGWRPASTVYLAPDRALPKDLGTAGALAATVDVRYYDAQRILYDVDTPADGWLVVTDAWYPGWTASVDGKPVPIYRADILFRAVRVPAGTHRVRLSFDSPAWESGATASMIAALFLLAMLAWGWRRAMKMV